MSSARRSAVPLPAADRAAALSVRDLTGPAAGLHALQLLVEESVAALRAAWHCEVRVLRGSRVVAVADNYDRLGYLPEAVTRDERYSRYLDDVTMLRSHTTAGVPPALRALAAEDSRAPADRDVLLVLPGMCYRRDAIDRLHVGTPHQMDLWRLRRGTRLGETDLDELIGRLLGAVLPGAELCSTPAEHPYTTAGRQVDVAGDAGWVEIAECGLAAPHVLATAGLDPGRWSGLALGSGLDRMLMLRKQVPDVRLLRAEDPRVAAQMLDLSPYRPVSSLPPLSRDLSVVTSPPVDREAVGDRVRTALGGEADALESVRVVSVTAYADLPAAARDRLQLAPDQVNALVRLVLRPLDRTLTDAEGNVLRDRVYAALHEGPVAEWAGTAAVMT